MSKKIDFDFIPAQARLMREDDEYCYFLATIHTIDDLYIDVVIRAKKETDQVEFYNDDIIDTPKKWITRKELKLSPKTLEFFRTKLYKK